MFLKLAHLWTTPPLASTMLLLCCTWPVSFGHFSRCESLISPPSLFTNFKLLVLFLPWTSHTLGDGNSPSSSLLEDRSSFSRFRQKHRNGKTLQSKQVSIGRVLNCVQYSLSTLFWSGTGLQMVVTVPLFSRQIWAEIISFIPFRSELNPLKSSIFPAGFKSSTITSPTVSQFALESNCSCDSLKQQIGIFLFAASAVLQLVRLENSVTELLLEWFVRDFPSGMSISELCLPRQNRNTGKTNKKLKMSIKCVTNGCSKLWDKD